jgi:flagellar biosynthesis GTPase FlhF
METFYNHTEPRDVDADAYAPAGLVSVRDLLAFRPDDVTAVVSGPQPVSIFYGPERVGKTLAITELAYRFALECAMPTVVIIGQNK